MLVLGIESSCDDTAAAVVKNGREILSNVVSSQIQYHQKFGGVVPEIASRKHLENILPVIGQALTEAKLGIKDLDAVAVTCGPGLLGSLLVGVSTAKAFAYAAKLPLIGINHLEGHLSALQLRQNPIPFPFLSLVISGGHSNLYVVSGHGSYKQLGQTRDDAVGEAFDKISKALGLEYPGGPVIDRLAKSGNPKAIAFPRTYLEKESFDFSFSGIKTAVWYFIKNELEKCGKVSDSLKADIAASFQAAAVEVLVTKAVKAALKYKIKHIAISGGVACNSELKRQMLQAANDNSLEFYYPEPKLCTDNAAMVASAGYFHYLKNPNRNDVHNLEACANYPLTYINSDYKEFPLR